MLESSLLSFVAIVSLIIPGAVIGRGIRKFYPNLDSIDLGIFFVLLSFLIVAVLAFILATLGAFHPLAVWILTLFIAGYAYDYLKDEEPNFGSIINRPLSLFLGLGLMILAYFSFDSPFEWMTYLHADVGRYSNFASLILKHHGIVFPLPAGIDFSQLTSQELFLPTHYYTSLPPNAEAVEVPYLHLFPTLYALFRAHVGIYDSFKVNWILLIFSASAFYLLLKLHLNDRPHALAGAFLLFSSPGSYLYAYRTMAEICCQLLFCSVFILLTFAYTTKQKRYFLLAALGSFLLATCRLEFGIIFFLIPVLYLIFYIQNKVNRSDFRLVFVSHCILAIPLFLYYYFYAARYLKRTLNNLFWVSLSFFRVDYLTLYRLTVVEYLMILFLPLLLVAIVYWLVLNHSGVSRLGSLKKFTGSVEKVRFFKFSFICQFSLILFLSWNLFIRPDLNVSSANVADRFNIYRLLAFVDPVTLILGILSLNIALERKNTSSLLALYGGVFTVLTLYRTFQNLPDTYWIRRYVAVSIPALYYLALLGSKELSRYLFLPYFIFAFILNISTARLITERTEQYGNFNSFNSIAKLFSDNSLQICINQIVCDQVSTPIATHFGVNTVNLKYRWNSRAERFFESLKSYPGPIFLTELTEDESKDYKNFVSAIEKVGYDLELIKTDSLPWSEYRWSVNVSSDKIGFLDRYYYRKLFVPEFNIRRIPVNFYQLKKVS